MSALIIDVPAAITRVACGRILSAVRARIRQGRGVCVWRYTRGEEWVHPVSPHLIKLARYIANIRLQTNQFSPSSAVNFTRDETRADCHTTSNRWKSSDIWKLFVKKACESFYLFICLFPSPFRGMKMWEQKIISFGIFVVTLID